MAGSESQGPAAPLVIQLFGPFDVRLNGAPLPRLRSRKGEWLLALLVLRHGREVERGWLVATLWPDSPESQASYNLRRSLTDLRRALGEEARRLRSPTPHTLALDLAGAQTDVVAFDAAMACDDPRALERAVALYRGPLLEGCAEEWAFQERQVREQGYLQALESLAEHAMVAGDPAAAERHLRRVVAVDPLRENAQRALLRALAAGGSYAAAFQLYRELRLHLRRELNAEPDAETRTLFEQIRAEARQRAGGRPPTTDHRSPNTQHPTPNTQRPPLPLTATGEGMVTFLFTDIEGSTKLWEELPEAMREAMARHDALLRAAIEGHGGSVFKTVGDQFCAAFATAPDALAAAVASQQALRDLGRTGFTAENAEDAEGTEREKARREEGVTGKLSGSASSPLQPLSASPSATSAFSAVKPSGSPLSIRVRMALYTGVAEERGGDYSGPALNRAARLLDAGHGGQILLSLATREMAGDALPEGTELRDLGEHRLKDLIRAERIFQVVTPELRADFPPLRSLEAGGHNLPTQLTSFVGRAREMTEVKELLASARLLTLTGSGGCGKTRLALQVAAELLEEYANGAWLVELAALADPALVPQTVASALSVREEPGRSLIETLGEHLKPKTLLLVVDNCEHLLSACALLADALLRSCPKLHILASSREGLGIGGEQTYRVPSLSLPDARHLPPLEKLQEFEAVQLFADRARLSQATFAVTQANAPAVAAVCQRLDGIPLAIELAAARVRAMPVEQIHARLDDMFRLLTGGSRTALPRQQTLRALIDWSYDLLSEGEQTLLRRLSVFAGGGTLGAAETVCSDFGFRISDFGLPDLTAEHAENAEHNSTESPGGLGGEIAPPQIRNPKSEIRNEEVLDLLTSLVDKSLVAYDDQSGEGRYRLLETVRQYARDRLLEAGEADRVRERHRDWFLELAEQAGPELDGAHQREWLDRLEREHDNLRAALAWSGAQGEGEAGLRLSVVLWRFWWVRAYWTEGREHLARLLALPGAEAGTATRATALHGAGWLALHQGEYRAARTLVEESLAISRELDDKQGIAWSLLRLGMVALPQGNYGAARVLLEESLAIFRELEDKRGAAWSLNGLGTVAREQGDYGAARALHEESRAIQRELGDRRGIAHSLCDLGEVSLNQGDCEAARALFEESLAIFRELGEKRGIAKNLERLAAVALAQAQSERATRLFGAAEGLREAMGAPLPPADRAEHDRSVAAARAALGEEAFAAAWAEGRTMPLEEAIQSAQEEAAGD